MSGVKPPFYSFAGHETQNLVRCAKQTPWLGCLNIEVTCSQATLGRKQSTLYVWDNHLVRKTKSALVLGQDVFWSHVNGAIQTLMLLQDLQVGIVFSDNIHTG